MIFLYGAPASGKSTLGAQLAERLGAPFLDLDAQIVAHAGRSIPEIFATEGELAFRDLESATLQKVIATAPSNAVVALGGGTLLRDANRAAVESVGTVFCLATPADDELARRLGLAAGSRPLGNKARERAPHYASFPNRIEATFDVGPSLVMVGQGLAQPILEPLPFVTDSNLAALYETRLPTPLAVIPAGEEHKTPATVQALWSAFAHAGLGRKDTIAALGGGVTGDLTGFAAATWMRGIDWINIPTTLLAMVDASTGGKTGCDLPEGKNLAGAFHPPKLVVIDTAFLKTLPPEILADGKAEMIKHELIGGRGRDTIASNLAVKVSIVQQDPFEKTGQRLLLNCGHTIGHAVEKLSNYAISHGSAVAVGCVAEAALAVRLGLAPATWVEEVAQVFQAAGLPTQLPAGMTLATLAPVMAGDKKKEKGTVVTFALPCGWGDVRAVPLDVTSEVFR